VEEAGLDVVGPEWSPIDNLTYSYMVDPGVTAEDEALEIIWDCQFAHWENVKDAFLRDNEPRMSPELMEFVQDCAKDLGLILTGKEMNMNDLVMTAGKPGVESVVDCVSTGVEAVYQGAVSPEVRW
jgi:hypothetical protein